MPPSKDDPSSGNSTPKIAIKGFSLSSKSNSSSSKPGAKPKPSAPSSSLGKRPRSTFAAHDDSGSDSEGEGRGRWKGKHEVVTGFGEEGAIKKDGEKRKEVLVIPRMENRDWRGTKAKRVKGKNLLPPEVQREREAKARGEGDGGKKVEGVDTVNSNDGEIRWGLSVRKRERSVEGETVVVEGEDIQASEPSQESKPQPEQTADQEALSALLGTAPEKRGPDLIIPTAANTNEKLSEEDAYKRSIAAAPDVSTLEDYERVPVEEFGAALLRGMGWKGEKVGKVRDVKRRQNLLGLGARELKDAEELGAWVQKSDVKRLNEKKGGRGERRPGVGEYKREKERREERREERGGGGYRREQERERERDRERGYRSRDGDKDRRR